MKERKANAKAKENKKDAAKNRVAELLAAIKARQKSSMSLGCFARAMFVLADRVFLIISSH